MKPVPAISVVADPAPPAHAPHDATPDGLATLVEAFAATPPPRPRRSGNASVPGAPTSARR